MMKKSILGILILSGILSATCTRNADETVSCSDTKLIWQDNSEAKTVKKDWNDAIDYCENLEFAGQTDWRLPNKNELLSIFDYAKFKPAIKEGFKNTSSSDYWSSTTVASFYTTSNAWSVDLNYGDTYGGYYKSTSHYVRCVRGGQ